MTFRRIAFTATLVAGGMVALLPASASATPSAPEAPAGGPHSLCAPPADTVGPTADTVTFGRSSIDLDSGSRSQSVSVHTSDTSGSGEASGVKAVQIYLRGNRSDAVPKLTLASGTPQSGTWRGSFEVSKYAHPGAYKINDLNVTDAAGNEQDYPGYSKVPEGPNALSLHPADNPTFTVTGTPATRPVGRTAGKLSAFSAGPARINTTSSGRLVHFAARFSGASPTAVVVDLDSPGKPRNIRFVYLRARLHEQHGRWTGAVRVPRWLGRQRLEAGLGADFGPRFRQRSRQYDSDQLAKKHFASRIAVTSGVDHSAPILTSLSLSPDPVDSTSGPERVTVMAKAKDTGSGVRSVEIYGGIRGGANGVAAGSYPFADSGVGYSSSQDFTVRLDKTAKGTWVGTATVRRCVPSGTYKLSAQVDDVAGNHRYYSSPQLSKAHLTSAVAVTSRHGDIVAPYVYSAATYGADGEVFLNFSEGVTDVGTSTLTVFALGAQNTRYQSPMTIASIVCSDGHQAVDCSGANELVTSAVLTVPGMTAGEGYEIWANQDQVTPQLADGNRNPLDWNYAATEVVDS